MTSEPKAARGAGLFLLIAGAVGGAALLARCVGERGDGGAAAGAEALRQGADARGREGASARGAAGPALDLRLAARAAITGVVTEVDGGPVAGAQVCAWPTGERLSSREARTPTCARAGADGRYRLDGLLPARQIVRAGAPGYAPGVHEQPGAFGPRHYLDLSPGQELGGVDVTLERGGVEVRGVVRDLSGGEVGGAEVQQGDAYAVAADDGAFALWVRPGDITLSARADGYAEGHSHGVAPGQFFEVFLTPESVLLGQVVRASDGAPIEGARVRAEGGTFWARGGEAAVSGADGRFRVDGLEPGVYKAIAEADDAYGVADAQVVLGLGETSESVLVRAHPAFYVDGRVEVEGGGACERGSVGLRDPAGGREVRRALDPGGVARLGGLLPGTYEVSVECEGMIAEERYEPVVIDDQSVDGARWRVRPGRSIRGVVVDAGGAPVPRVHVMASPKAAPRVHKTAAWGHESGRDGAFVLGGLLPGVYELDVALWGRRAAPEPLVVTVAEGEDLTGVRIELPAGGEVRGHVRDPRGRGLAGVDVSLRGGARSFSASTADDGSFRAEHVAVGEYRAVARRDFALLRAPGSTDDDLQGERVAVAAGAIAEVDLVVEAADGEIRGVVRDEGGALVADAFIDATRESESAAAAAGGAARDSRWGAFFKAPLLTDADGRFTAAGLAPGRYTIRAHRRGGGEGILEHVELGGDVTVTLAATADLAGVVVIPGGEPPERFTVALRDDATGFDRSDEFFRSAGAWRLPEVPAGKYKVRVDAPTASAEIGVSLEAGEDKTGVRIELAPRVTVRGQVVDLDGAPIPGYRVFIASGGGGLVLRGDDGGDKRDVTDADGRFEVERAPVGVVRVTLFPEDRTSELPWTVVPAQIPGGEAVYEAPPIQVALARVGRGEVSGDLGFTLKAPEPDADPLDARLEVAVVRRGGPAAKAGLRPGDVITSVDGHDVRGASAHLYRTLARVRPGVALRLGLGRGGAVELRAGAPP